MSCGLLHRWSRLPPSDSLEMPAEAVWGVLAPESARGLWQKFCE